MRTDRTLNLGVMGLVALVLFTILGLAIRNHLA